MPFLPVYHQGVSQEQSQMNGHNRLVRRNHTYYLWARIPSALVYLESMFLFGIGFITFIKFGYPRVVYGDLG